MLGDDSAPHARPQASPCRLPGLAQRSTYTGQRLDELSGLMYYGARWYDPQIGRFVSADSIVPEPGNPQSLNRYTCVHNDPLRYTDPSGRLTDDQCMDYTDYNTQEELDRLRQEHPEIYWALRALHLGDWVWARNAYWRASLVDGRLFFAPWGHEGAQLEVGDLIGSKFISIERPTPELRNVFVWIEGEDAEAAYEQRWRSVDAYHKVSNWECLGDYHLKNAVGSELIGAGIGLLLTPVTGGASLVIGIGLGVALDLGLEMAPVPYGRDAGDETFTYTYEDRVETTIIRDGRVVENKWAPR